MMTDECFDGNDAGGDAGSDAKAGAVGLDEDSGIDLNDDTTQCLENEADTGEAANAGTGAGGNSGEDLNYVDVPARDVIVAAAMSNIDSPKPLAQLIGFLLPGDYPGGPASEARTRLVQMGIDGIIAGSKSLMEGVYRQYGNPDLRTLEIQHQLTPRKATIPNNEHKEDA
jgi:hypothetical protein